MGGLLGAFGFLTRLPVPGRLIALDRTVPWLPVVGVALGAILAGLDWLLRRGDVNSLVISAVLVVTLLVLTGALHADGLMDTCDAVFSHATPERRLEIMRDPRVGAFGVVGLVSVVLLKVAAIDALPDANRTQMLLVAPTLGRWAIVLLATLFPYGRPTGMGGDLKAGATRLNLGVASLVAVGVCVLGGVVGIASAVVAGVVAVAFGRWVQSLLPGLTGDVYGATCELVETVVWLSAAPLARWVA